MTGMRQFSLRYLLLDVALWGLAIGLLLARNDFANFRAKVGLRPSLRFVLSPLYLVLCT